MAYTEWPEEVDEAKDLMSEADYVVAKRLRDRIIKHLADKLERDLREGLPKPPPSGEQVAYALIQSLGHDLQAAAAILERSAKALNSAGSATEANLAMVAARRAKEAATNVLE